MSDFSAEIYLRPHTGGLWIVDRAMPFDLVYGDPSTRLVIPKGYVSDGPSIPAIARAFFNPSDARYMKAAFVHDWMLTRVTSDSVRIFTGKECARAFRDALRAADVKPWRVAIMYWAVLIWSKL